MRINICKNQKTQFPSGEGRAEFQIILSNYFESHSFEETEVIIELLVSAYICSDSSYKRTTEEIANIAFAVSNLNTLLRKVNAVDSLDLYGLQDAGSIKLLIGDFFDNCGLDFFDEILQESLQSWIYPTDYSEHFEYRLADTVDAFWQLNKLVRKLEAIYYEFTEKGGVCHA